MKKQQIAQHILRTCLGGVVITSMFFAPGIGPAVDMFSGEKERRRRVRQELSRLERKGLIKRAWDGRYERVRLTKKGITQAKRAQVDALAIPVPKKWDGVWRIVLFDFPAKMSTSRHIFRGKIASLGFYQIQRSVYAYPHACHDQIAELSDLLALSEGVKVLEVQDLGNDEEACRKHFRLR